MKIRTGKNILLTSLHYCDSRHFKHLRLFVYESIFSRAWSFLNNQVNVETELPTQILSISVSDIEPNLL